MSLEDLPQFPKKYKPRGDVLIQRVQRKEISINEVINTLFSVMKKLRIDSSGVNVIGDFGSMGVDSKVYVAMNQSLDKMVPYIMYVGMEIIKRRISSVYKPSEEPQKIYLRFGDRIIRLTIKAFIIIPAFVTEKEMRDTKYPVIEIIPREKLISGGNPLLDLFMWYIGSLDLPAWTEYVDVKIHRPEQIVEFMDLVITSWADMGDMLELVLPMTALMTKETMDRLAESYPAFWDEVFTRFGV